MLRRWLCQADVTVRITPVDPVLIKSGYATVDGPDMVPVSTFRGTERVYYLPGTSLKGVLRSHLERVARTLRPGSVCLPYYERAGKTPVPVPSEAGAFGCGYRARRTRAEDTSAEAYADSCAACRTFGSLKFGGRLGVGDAYPLAGHAPQTEQRNGVGIDRFTGGTVPGVLFDLVVLVGGVFETRVRLVNFETWQLAALGLLLVDLRDEMIHVGSGRSRGLGRVKGEVVDYRIAYLSGVEHLRGLFDLATAEEREHYRLSPWAPARPVPLPPPRTSGLRREHDVTATWLGDLAGLAPSFDDFLAWHGGPKGAPDRPEGFGGKAGGRAMTAILKCGDIAPNDLPGLVGQALVTGVVWIWAEGPDGWVLDDWAGPDAPVRWYAAGRSAGALPGRDVLDRALAGRVFAPSGELKWRVLDSPGPPRCRVVFLGERDWLPGRLEARDELERLGMTAAVESAILWGQKTAQSDGDWVELRVPHRFRYPVAEAGVDVGPGGAVGVRVSTEVWSDRRGEPHFVRLRELVAYPISEGS